MAPAYGWLNVTTLLSMFETVLVWGNTLPLCYTRVPTMYTENADPCDTFSVKPGLDHTGSLPAGVLSAYE